MTREELKIWIDANLDQRKSKGYFILFKSTQQSR